MFQEAWEPALEFYLLGVDTAYVVLRISSSQAGVLCGWVSQIAHL